MFGHKGSTMIVVFVSLTIKLQQFVLLTQLLNLFDYSYKNYTKQHYLHT